MPRTPSPEASTDPTQPDSSQSPTTVDPEAASRLFSKPTFRQPESGSPTESLGLSDLPPSPSNSLSHPLEYDDGSGSDPLSTGAEPAPSTPKPASPARRRKQLLTATTAAVETITGAAHQLLTVDGSPERDHGLWLATEEEISAIADPLAGLASRRMPEGVDNPDVSDLIRLAIGLASYGMRQLQLRTRLRALFRPQPVPADVAEGMQDPDDAGSVGDGE